jgi:D-beta-D-heptose 7-phosphate kinase/D-beta-D-heptose 1-phosphate adenosyltransferase
MRKVFTNGCFDLLHVGHARLLEFAGKQGDHLVVGIDDDDSVESLKGQNRPIVPIQERAQLLASIKWVDEVVVFSGNEELQALLDEINPDVIVKGSDWQKTQVVKNEGASVVLFDHTGHSSTNIIKKIGDQFTSRIKSMAPIHRFTLYGEESGEIADE